MRNILIVVVLVLWALLGWKMCTDYPTCCDPDATATTTTPAKTVAVTPTSSCLNGPICFEDNTCTPTFGDGFDALRDSLTRLVSSDTRLKITGVYNTNESYDGSSSNLGTCRAESIRDRFEELADEKIVTTGQLTVGRQVGISERYELEIINDAPSVEAEAIIYFPFNSTNKLNDRDTESYLKEVAESIKSSGGKVHLIGHTDDIGSVVSNEKLGQRRANIIADYLMGQGVFRSQIISESQGEAAPIASNKTEVGRAKNRRTELRIVK